MDSYVASRRDFFKWTAAAGGSGLLASCSSTPSAPEQPAAESKPAPSTAPFTKDIGAQLYTVRSILPEKTKETLQAIAAIGYKEVEILQDHLDSLLPLLSEAGLKPVSAHLDSALVMGEKTKTTLDAVLKKAKDGGLSYVVMPYVPNERRGGLDVYKSLAEKLNKTGQAAKDAGLRLAYHNHAFEFEPLEGSSPLDTLLSATDPALVGIELDVFWVSVAGKDPVEMLRQYAGRVPLVHLKDKAKDAPQQFKESVPPEAFKELGNGTLNFAAILKAGEESHVEHYFVEQDQTPGDPVASLKTSYDYLRSLQV